MGRRRRKVVRIPKKHLPKIFLCPKCGKESIRVTINKDEHIANVECGSCGLKDELTYLPALAPVDIYCKFVDRYYAKSQGIVSS